MDLGRKWKAPFFLVVSCCDLAQEPFYRPEVPENIWPFGKTEGQGRPAIARQTNSMKHAS